MTDQATRFVSAGWYQDPASSQMVRWWNGVAWTEHVREKPTAASASSGQVAIGQAGLQQSALQQGGGATSTVSETTEQRIAAARDLERQFGIGTSEIPVVASKAPVANAAQAALAAKRAAAHASTAAAWLIALSPILALVLGIVAAYVYLYLLPTPVVFVIAAVVPYVLCLLWALGDSRTLKARGFHPPSPAFALLSGLGYLIVRRTRVPGFGPIAMLLVVTVLSFGLPLVAVLSGQTQGLANALNIQRTISADYIGQGKAVSVNCPPFVDTTTVGSLYTCDATTGTGVHRTIWVSIDGANGRFSYSFGL